MIICEELGRLFEELSLEHGGRPLMMEITTVKEIIIRDAYTNEIVGGVNVDDEGGYLLWKTTGWSPTHNEDVLAEEIENE